MAQRAFNRDIKRRSVRFLSWQTVALLSLCIVVQTGICETGLFAQSSSNAAPDVRDENVRASSRDAANCLYVFARVLGIAVEYSKISETLSGDNDSVFSLADIQQAAENNQVSLQAGKTDLAGLDQLSKPILVHLDHDRHGVPAGRVPVFFHCKCPGAGKIG